MLLVTIETTTHLMNTLSCDYTHYHIREPRWAGSDLMKTIALHKSIITDGHKTTKTHA